MNKSVIPKDYLVDKSDNALLAKNKKKGGGLEKNVWINIVVIILFDFSYIDYNTYFVNLTLGQTSLK